jgi:HK97 family phage portal protein
MWDRLLGWLGLEHRDLSLNDPALQRLYGTGTGSATGEAVSLERAVSLSAVWACVSLISGAIASMPLILYRKTDEGREKAVEHPLFSVLRERPNPVQSVVAFWEAIVTSLLLRGNAYALITKDDDGRVRALWMVAPDRVRVDVTKTGTLRYEISTPQGTTKIPPGGMLHITGPLSDDGYLGRSVIQTCRDTLGFGLALESYGSEFFANSATPRGVLTAPQMLTPAATQKLKDSVDASQRGRGRRQGTMVLENGMKWEPIALSHEDSQFLGSRAFSVEEIARLFAVPPIMIGHALQGTSTTYSNAELESLRLVKHTLGPWMSRIESAVAFACISPLERRQLYCEFLSDALLAPDTRSRYEAYRMGVEGGWLTLDEVRAKENLPPLPDRVPAIG